MAVGSHSFPVNQNRDQKKFRDQRSKQRWMRRRQKAYGRVSQKYKRASVPGFRLDTLRRGLFAFQGNQERGPLDVPQRSEAFRKLTSPTQNISPDDPDKIR